MLPNRQRFPAVSSIPEMNSKMNSKLRLLSVRDALRLQATERARSGGPRPLSLGGVGAYGRSRIQLHHGDGSGPPARLSAVRRDAPDPAARAAGLRRSARSAGALAPAARRGTAAPATAARPPVEGGNDGLNKRVPPVVMAGRLRADASHHKAHSPSVGPVVNRLLATVRHINPRGAQCLHPLYLMTTITSIWMQPSGSSSSLASHPGTMASASG